MVAFPENMVPNGSLDLVEILRVYTAEPLIGGVVDLGFRVAEDRLLSRTEDDVVCLEIPVPESVICPLGGEHVSLLRFP